VLEGHTQNVNGVAFAPDGRTLVSVSYDQSVRIWPLSGTSAPTLVAMPSPLNAVAIGGDGEIVAGGHWPSAIPARTKGIHMSTTNTKAQKPTQKYRNRPR
jgi:WD40 repeat protein